VNLLLQPVASVNRRASIARASLSGGRGVSHSPNGRSRLLRELARKARRLIIRRLLRCKAVANSAIIEPRALGGMVSRIRALAATGRYPRRAPEACRRNGSSSLCRPLLHGLHTFACGPMALYAVINEATEVEDRGCESRKRRCTAHTDDVDGCTILYRPCPFNRLPQMTREPTATSHVLRSARGVHRMAADQVTDGTIRQLGCGSACGARLPHPYVRAGNRMPTHRASYGFAESIGNFRGSSARV
jgi:hypothetical protein